VQYKALAGFKAAVHENVRIEPGATVRIDTRMEVGAVQQSILVSAEATTLRSDDAKMQNTVPDELIEGLPAVVSDNMRSPFDLAVITAGVNGGRPGFPDRRGTGRVVWGDAGWRDPLCGR